MLCTQTKESTRGQIIDNYFESTRGQIIDNY